MSFSSETKDELIRLELSKECCMLAELASLTQTTASLGFLGMGRMSLTWRVESAALARRIYRMIKRVTGFTPRVEYVHHARLGGRKVSVLVMDGEGASQLMLLLGMLQRKADGSLSLKRTTPQPHLGKSCCRRAFVRGAFLGAGSIGSPDKQYQMEFVTGEAGLSVLLSRCLEKSGILASTYVRGGREVVYLKASDQIAAVLAMMDASSSLMRFENIRITRHLRGNINRASHCDDHNLERTIRAAEKQVEAITQLSIARGLSSLPKTLRETAEARMNNPDMSLIELGKTLDPPVGKSGMNHRMRQLMAICEQLEAENAAGDDV